MASQNLNSNFAIFSLSHFAAIIGESDTLQRMMILSGCHGNNQDSIYELSVVHVEGNKV